MRMGAEFSSWEAEPHSLVVYYTNAVMEEIRRAAMEGLRKVPRRGLEVGGVLFGTHEGNEIRITRWRTIECEHAEGPGFALSASDEEGLRQLLDEAEKDPELGKLTPLGWFRTRTRGGVCLSEDDVKLHDRFFPEPWQVILVLRPYLYDPAQAGFFLREADGSIGMESSSREFLLENKQRRLPLGFDPSQAVQRPAEGEGAPHPVPRLPLAPGREAYTPPGTIAAAGERPVKPSRWWRAGSVVAVAAAAALTLYLAVPVLETGGRTSALDLEVRNVGDQLLLEWNPRAPAVANAVAASLAIVDGDTQRRVQLTPEELRSGSLTYQRQGGDVQFRLRLEFPEGEPLTELTRFLGAAPAANAELPESGEEASPELAAIIDQLQKELAAEARRADELRRQIQAERQRLGVAGQ